MVDHLVRAGAMRDRAKRCEAFASQTKSEKFADCYRLLSQNYNILDTVEEEQAVRSFRQPDKIGKVRRLLPLAVAELQHPRHCRGGALCARDGARAGGERQSHGARGWQHLEVMRA